MSCSFLQAVAIMQMSVEIATAFHVMDDTDKVPWNFCFACYNFILGFSLHDPLKTGIYFGIFSRSDLALIKKALVFAPELIIESNWHKSGFVVLR